MPLPLLPLAISGISALGGWLSNRKAARTSTTTPTFNPADEGLAGMLRQRLTDRLTNPTSLAGYQASGIANINDVYKGVDMANSNNLTARGLGTSPVAAAVGEQSNLARGGEIARFTNTLPLIQRQLEGQDFSAIQDYLGLRRGASSVGAGSGAGGGIGSAAEMLAFLAGKGLLGGG